MLALVDCLVQEPYDPVHARSGLGEPRRREPATLDKVSCYRPAPQCAYRDRGLGAIAPARNRK